MDIGGRKMAGFAFGLIGGLLMLAILKKTDSGPENRPENKA